MRGAELIAAATLLTRLPLARRIDDHAWPDAAASVWAYPLVGATVGAAAGAVFWLGRWAALPPAVAAVLSLAAMLLLTGALHEDGLADTADGFGGGATRARKLEIMRDSRIGTYGALALIAGFGLRAAALAAMPPAAGLAASIAAGGLGRGGIVLLLLLLRPARTDGTAASLQSVRLGTAAIGLALAGLSPWLLAPGTARLCLIGAVLASLGIAALSHRQIGGYTGDSLGAAEVAVECAVFCIAAASLA